MKKILLFHYHNGAGGKFIANCLTYSGKVAFQDFNVAQQIVQHNNIQLLEETLLQIIPDKQQSQTWFNYEPGCISLFGKGISRIKKKLPVLTELYPVEQLGDIWLPLVTHTASAFINCLNYFSKDSNIVTVLVDGTPEFIELAYRLKWPSRYQFNSSDYRTFRDNLSLLKFDFVFKEWNPIDEISRQQIPELANYLGFKFDLGLANNFINKYTEFHL